MSIYYDDSDCSCPEPFESYRSMDLNPLRVGEMSAFESEVEGLGASIADANNLVRHVSEYLRSREVSVVATEEP